jgi:hypothetical protein
LIRDHDFLAGRYSTVNADKISITFPGLDGSEINDVTIIDDVNGWTG